MCSLLMDSYLFAERYSHLAGLHNAWRERLNKLTVMG